MNNVRSSVEKMFAKFPQTEETIELKEEVIGNLEAEIEDLQEEGYSFEEAFRLSIEKVSSLDGLIEGVHFVDTRKLVLGMLQWTLIYILIAWIMTIPFNMIGVFRRATWFLFLLIILMGLIYLILFMTRALFSKGRTGVNFFKVAAIKRRIWLLWSLFVLLAWGGVTGVTFSSNIWFSTPVSISGPYEFANIAAAYLLPLMTIIVPLLMNRLERYVENHEGEADEWDEN